MEQSQKNGAFGEKQTHNTIEIVYLSNFLTWENKKNKNFSAWSTSKNLTKFWNIRIFVKG